MNEQQLAEYKELSEMSPVLGKPICIGWYEGGGGMVYRVEDVYVLFSVPLFGGIPQYENTYQKGELDKLIREVYDWT